jgi:type IV secretory pathway VirD2 relaxase
MVRGFEEVWRPPVRLRAVTPTSILPKAASSSTPRARLARLAARAPEVMVKVTGRTRDGAHLKAHLDYISRNGRLELEGPDGATVVGRAEVADLADEWAGHAMADSRRRANTPFSHSIVLSMPAGTNEVALRDAAHAFAADTFAGRHAYVLTLHTDTPRPHVHVSVCSRGDTGERLNPKKADLERWRQVFAQALRDRGVAAEATPRRARGVTRKPERGPVRRMRERAEAGRGEPARVRRSAYQEAAKAAFQGDTAPRPWETRTVERQARTRALYVAQAQLLQKSADATDQALGRQVEAFVRSMPQPDSQRLALARQLRAASRSPEASRSDGGLDRERDR